MTSVDSVPAFLLAGVPVLQPPHLEGDPSLATEILPGPPPLLSLQQGTVQRKDKKSSTSYSYLPLSDPGTTFGAYMANPLATTSTEADGPRRKRARLDKGGSSSRAQRASARQLAAPDPSIAQEALVAAQQAADSDPIAPWDDDDVMMVSRSNSVPNGDYAMTQEPAQNGDEDGSASVLKRPRRDKGKGKEKEAAVRVKEEPGTISLSLNDAAPAVSNEDHCSSCRSFGSLVYCDSCPRAFHLMCLNPPVEGNELQGDANWYCPACTLRKEPPSKPPASLKFMAPLFDNVQSTIPHEFQLPAEIRTFFKDVGTSNRGTYVDSSEVKPPRLNRHGQLEDRDPYRLRDRNGEPVLCFKCGTSALPPGVSASVPAMKRPRRASSRLSSTLSDTGKSIISCDYCHLHWHLDCVDPPLSLMPPWSKKWMCPNHADQILKPKKRVPRGATSVDVVKPGEVNNGNIEVIQPEASLLVQPTSMAIEEVLINGRRYRVPEKIITMDFWKKTRRREPLRDDEVSSAMSSPLTSISSLEDGDDATPPTPKLGLFNVEELKAAMLLAGMHSKPSSAPRANGTTSDSKAPVASSSTTTAIRIKEEPDLHVNGLLHGPESASKRKTTTRTPRAPRAAKTARATAVPASRGVRSSARVQAVTARKNAEAELERMNQDTEDQGLMPPPVLKPSQKALHTTNGIITDPGPSSQQHTEALESASATSSRVKRARQPRVKPPPSAVTKSASHNGVVATQDLLNGSSSLSSVSQADVAGPSSSADGLKKKPSLPRGRRPKPITPNPSGDKPSAVTPISTPTNAGSSKPAGSTTPSLKIRLPRLSSISSPIVASTSTSTSADQAPASSRSKQTRTRQLSDKQPDSSSVSNDGPSSATDGAMLPPA
ncbi:hypothetical protein EIP91_004800 [Steccherinum ochraceum]|uniref:PHD-type domain-containing protein n=1 Tax=Steccherinum ochraceum TaxID=92696 RepID=A0A4R0R853_9APHY|nr:hypothetical protein EIP91_004800 [Steccherinum ochraceum]